jgi:hypothetical protein
MEMEGAHGRRKAMKRSGFDHPKVGRLCKLLGVERFAAVGIVESLWHFTAKHAPAGDVGKWSDAEIAESMGWSRDAGELVKAMVDARLLDELEGARLAVHDWPEHCEDSIHCILARKTEFFADGTKPKLSRLHKSERPEIIAAYALLESSKTRARTRKRVDPRTAHASHALAKPCQAMPSQDTSNSSEPAAPASEPAVSEIFPCVGTGPKEFPLTEAKVSEYESAYPGVNIRLEARAIKQWCIDNPSKRKTFDGMPRFLNQWFKRVQDRGGGSPQAAAFAQQPKSDGISRALAAAAALGER